MHAAVHNSLGILLERQAQVLEKYIMEELTTEFNKLSEEEKARRAQSLQRLMDSELQRRQEKRSSAKPDGPLALIKKLFS